MGEIVESSYKVLFKTALMTQSETTKTQRQKIHNCTGLCRLRQMNQKGRELFLKTEKA